MSHMDRQNSICLSTFGRSSVWILCQQVSHYPSQNTTTTGKQDRRQGLLQTIQTRLALSPSSLHSLRSVPFQGQFFVAAGEASALRGIYHHQVGTAVRLYAGLEYVLPSNAVVVAGDTSRNQAGRPQKVAGRWQQLSVAVLGRKIDGNTHNRKLGRLIVVVNNVAIVSLCIIILFAPCRCLDHRQQSIPHSNRILLFGAVKEQDDYLRSVPI